MGPDQSFRYNFDLWRDYRLEVTDEGFCIEDLAGRTITSQTVSKFYYRKPFQTKDIEADITVSAQDAYCEAELWYALRDLTNLLWASGKIVLVEPRADMRVGKFVQMRVARDHFAVPQYRFQVGRRRSQLPGKTVAKSLTLESVSGKKNPRVLYTTRVSEDELSPAYPWMIQQYVDASKDITVVFVRDELFAFELDRLSFKDETADWRELPLDSTVHLWRPHTLDTPVGKAVFSFMNDLGLQFGRLDFLYDGATYWFLEVNPNGQWAWLDAEGSNGLLDKMIAELSPLTPCHPIPANLSSQVISPFPV
jgi:hypothetical protein